jgi:hypothetical protein
MRGRVADVVRAAVLVPLLAPLVAGCGGDPTAGYCDAVAEHQQQLGDIVASGAPEALIDALDVFQDLQEHAPGDISDEWQQVVGRIEALADALERAGVDPATYDREDPPAGVTGAERALIDAAAQQLGSATTVRAFQDLDQQARDVCQTPLSL